MAHGDYPELPPNRAPSGRTEPGDDLPPTLRCGPYRIDQVIGRGGMAVVHKARRVGARDMGEQLAVKRIVPEFSRTPSFVRMFRREAHIGGQLEHPNVVRVVDFGEQDGELLLVTEYVDGTSCSRILSHARKRGECFPLPVALHVACEVLEALAYTHDFRRPDGSGQGIVHRDVSPGNILIGTTGEVKLGDFGVARSLGEKRDTNPRTLKGKVGYMSPEQVGGREVDGRSDLFSLGVVVFELLTGTPLFSGKDDFERLAKMHESPLSPLSDGRSTSLPFELRLVLATALARDLVERFWDAREFSRAIRGFARHAGIALERSALAGWLSGFDSCLQGEPCPA